jgi:DnaK suppressor protein
MATAKTKLAELIHGIKPYRAKKREQYMNDNQQDHFKAILSAWRQESINLPDPNDRATQETDRSFELRTRDRERKLIKKIEESIGMIDSGDYGYCDSCGVPIGIKRLEARPTANQCIDCKTLDEIREKQLA